MKNSWLACDTAVSCVSPSAPTISVSTMLMPTEMIVCSATGTAINRIAFSKPKR